MTTDSKREFIGLALAGILIAAFAIYLSGWKLLWFDEFFTLNISKFTGASNLLLKLTSAGDFQFPLFYTVHGWSLSLFGESNVALRLPSVLFFTGTVWMVFLIVRCYLPIGYAAVGGLLLMMHFPFAYEARPYAMYLFFSACVLYFWIKSHESDDTRILVQYLFALTLAFHSHLYAFYLAIPIALAEFAEAKRCGAWNKRRILLSLTALASVLIYLPIVRYASTYSEFYWASISIRKVAKIFSFYYCWPLLLIAGLYFLSKMKPRLFKQISYEPMPNPVIILFLGTACLPMFGLLSATITGMYTNRHFIAGGVGLAVILPIVIAKYFAPKKELLSLLVLGIVCLDGLRVWQPFIQDKSRFEIAHHHTKMFASDNLANQKVYFANPLDFVPIWQIAPPDIQKNLYLVYEKKESGEFVGGDTMNRSITDLNKYLELNIVHANDVLKRDETLYLFTRTPGSWFDRKLESIGRASEQVEDSKQLYRFSRE